jgi:hypothetical protein
MSVDNLTRGPDLRRLLNYRRATAAIRFANRKCPSSSLVFMQI